MILENWELSCYYPYVPLFYNIAESSITQKSILPTIKVKLPGSVQKALFENGMIEDPFYETNSLKCEWIEHKWWVYSTNFILEDIDNQKLIIKGIDYKAKILINGKLCGESNNVFVPFENDISEYLSKGENNIQIILEGAQEEMGQIGLGSKVVSQKPRFVYKWDFGTRLVHLGIMGNVEIKKINNIEIGNILFNGDGNGSFKLNCDVKTFVKETTVNFAIKDDENAIVFKKDVAITKEDKTIYFEGEVSSPKLWNPNGYGKSNLYTLEITIDEEKIYKQIGFKEIKCLKNENNDNSPYGYLFEINNKKIYLKGVNLTPLEILYSDIKEEKYINTFEMLKKANVNLIRVWGGGLIENEIFYDLADRYGIMIWQEFIQSGAGMDSLPSIIPEYLENLKRTAEEATNRACHVSLIAFSGGNELYNKDSSKPADFDNENLIMLKNIVESKCPWVFMYPTSPSGGEIGFSMETIGHHFDIHGPWQYIDNFYKFYNISDSLLHSEFGVDGFNNITFFNKYLSKHNRKVTNMAENYVWRHHGEWWDTSFRDNKIFGYPKNLNKQIYVSQFIQAEGLRYAIEANRRRAYNNSGTIIWQATEPFPNASGNNIIDYFGKPKLAYYKVKQAYNRVNPNLKYEKLIYKQNEMLKAQMFLTAEGDVKNYNYTCCILVDGKKINEFTGFCEIGDGYSKYIKDIEFSIPKCKVINVVMTATSDDNNVYTNDVLFLVKQGEYADVKCVVKYIKKIIKENK